MKNILNISYTNKSLLHVGSWLIYIIYVYLLNLLTNKELNPLFIFVYIIPFIGLFYLLLYGFKIAKKNIYIGGFFLVFLFVGFSGIAFLLLTKTLPYFGIILTAESFSIKVFFQSVIIEFIKFFTYALLYHIIKELIDREKRIRKIKEEKHILEIQKKEQELENAELIQKELLAQKEKIQYQYAFLRAQINPHFLYNTLNVLFAQALPLSEDLANNIMKLSDLMRYSLDNVETENMKVPLQKEIDHLLTLIDIHHLRFSNSKFIDYSLNGSTENHFLPPLSIITVIENAFKYGELSNPEFPLIIKIDTTSDSLYFTSRNKKKKNSVEVLSNNVGLDNLSKRLDFAFRDKYKIDITNDNDFYTFELTIKK